MRGFTLIEVVVVTAILIIISLTSIETIVEFQKQSILENTTRELVSTLRQAQNKSTAGELPQGAQISDYTSTGLPQYGVSLAPSAYNLFRTFTLVSSGPGTDTITSFNVDPTLTLSYTNNTFQFIRLSGISAGGSITVSRTGGETKTIHIDSNGVISVTSP